MARKHRRRSGRGGSRLDGALLDWSRGRYGRVRSSNFGGGVLLQALVGGSLAFLALIRDWWRGGKARS